MALVDERLIELGWEPIAVEGKIPRTKYWQTLPRTVSTLADERRQCPNATNTGIRCGQISAVDIDLIIESQVAAMRALAFEALGETPLERTGMKGVLLAYRNAAPCAKINVTYQNPNGPGRPRAVEILGAGQQFVAYGLHPDTGLAYRWAALDPSLIAPEELPLVTPERLREFAAQAVALLASWGYKEARMTGERVKRDTPAGFEPDSHEAIAEAQRHLRALVERGDVPKDGNRNALTHAVAVRLCCIGVGEDTCVEMMREQWTKHGDEPDEGLEYVVDRAYNHPATDQNPPGSELGRWAPLTGDVFKAALDKLRSNPLLTSAAAQASPYPHTRISDAVRRPPPTYHDRLMLLTHVPLGSVNMIFAKHSNYKTTLVFNHLLATMAERPELRVMMVIGEGSGGFGPKTVQAGIALWNKLHPEQPVTPEWFDERFALVEEMPQLTDDASVADWCEKYLGNNPWGVPHIIIFDTLATAMAGANLSATESATSALRRLTQIATKLHCDIFFVHHQSLGSKDDPRGAGSEFWANNVESVLFLRFDREHGYVEVKSAKNRWGADLSVRFGVQKAGITFCDGSTGEHVATHELPPGHPDRPENEAATKRRSMVDLKNEILRHVAFGGKSPPTADKLREAMGSTADTTQVKIAMKELLQIDALVLKKDPSRLEIGTVQPPKHAVEH
jgi:hypothetical protein